MLFRSRIFSSRYVACYIVFHGVETYFIQPLWTLPDQPIRDPSVDVVSQWPEFLERVSGWIKSRRERQMTNRFVSVFEAVRGDESVWGGCGVYSTSEILFIAGDIWRT